MPTEAIASPLIVWFGHNRFTFPVGRDVTIGRDSRADIRVDGAGTSTSPTQVVVHHNGRQWIAVDRGEGGIYVDGVRMSTVFIHDGRAITLGDPQHGPRLVFQLGPPPPPPPPPPPRRAPHPEMRPAPPPPTAIHRGPVRPSWPPPGPPPPRPDRPKMPQVPPSPPAMPMPMPPAPPRVDPPTRSEQPAPPTTRFHQPPPPVPWPPAARKPNGLVEALTGAMQKLRPQRPQPRPHEAAPTTALRLPDTPEPKAAKTSAAQAPPPRPAVKSGRLEARHLRLTVDGEQVLADLSFTAEPETLTAVIGHSAASTAALVDVLGGAVQPSVGTVRFAGHDVAADDLRPRIGVVPRYDLLHPALTIDQALGYAAELRLPPGTSADHRRHSVRLALDEMKLGLLRTVQVGKLTDEQRKRASIAVELLTEPAFLVLDEPTAGLDEAAEREMTATLRRLADGGRVVVVATASPTDIDSCDQVVLLTGTGTPAFAGPPAEIGAELGTTDWTEIISRVTADPYRAHDAYLARQPETPPAPESIPVEPPAPAARLSLWHQVVIAARRQGWLTVGDQRYFIFLSILPVLFGAISLLVPGNAGLGPANPYGSSPDEAVEILFVLTIGAVVIGTALGIRDLFGEQRIFRREQAHGLSASALLAGKVIVYSLVAIVASAITTTAAVVGKGTPTRGAVLLGDTAFGAAVELFVVLTVTAIVSAMVALALSSLASYSEQIVLAAVLIVLLSAVFAGAMFPIAGRFGVEQVSWLVPARWGFAASASTVDVPAVNLLAAADDSWKHSTDRWLFDMSMLVAFGVVATGSLRWRLRRPARRSDEPKDVVAQQRPQS